MSRPLVGARWEYLLYLSYRCPSGLLAPLVPAGTELDPWQGDHYLTLVGRYTRETLVRGLAIPCHRDFEAVTLCFHVRRRDPGGAWRAGTVSIRELVPRRAIAALARRWFQAPALAVVMSNANDLVDPRRGLVAYFWSVARKKFSLVAGIAGPPADPLPDSHAAFVTRRPWGYARTRSAATLEYRIAHPDWQVWIPEESSAEGPMHVVFGNSFAYLFTERPAAACVATGSAVSLERAQYFPGE